MRAASEGSANLDFSGRHCDIRNWIGTYPVGVGALGTPGALMFFQAILLLAAFTDFEFVHLISYRCRTFLFQGLVWFFLYRGAERLPMNQGRH